MMGAQAKTGWEESAMLSLVIAVSEGARSELEGTSVLVQEALSPRTPWRSLREDHLHDEEIEVGSMQEGRGGCPQLAQLRSQSHFRRRPAGHLHCRPDSHTLIRSYRDRRAPAESPEIHPPLLRAQARLRWEFDPDLRSPARVRCSPL